jgi:hypothetical protein
VQTPAFKKAVDTDVITADSSVLKPLPMLAAVYINHSRFGVLLYRCSYAVFALSLLLVFYPFISEQPLWLFGLTLCWGGVWLVYRRESRRCVTGALSYSGDHWLLEQDGSTYQLTLAGDVLCWPWLIILPLREIASGKIRWILIFGDALNKDDNARLRRWLRACLTPKA